MPENENECLVEKSFLTANNKQIGDTIILDVEDQTNDDGEEVSYLKQNELTIVGTAQSPLYISSDRGTSSLGAGKVNYYMYIPEENINATDVYTNIYIKVKDANKYTTSSNAYENYIEKVTDDIEEIKEERENARRDSLVQKAEDKVNEAEQELNEQKAKAEKEIKEAEDKLSDAEKEIANGEKEINQNKEKADKEFANAEKEIEDAKKKIENGEEELKTKEEEANKTFEDLENQKKDLEGKLEQVNTGLTTIKEQYSLIISALGNSELGEEQKVAYTAQKNALDAQIEELEKNKAEIEAGIKEIENGISSGKAELESAKKEIEDGKAEIAKNEKELEKSKSETYSKIESAKKDLEEAKEELEDGKKELNESKEKFEKEIADAESKLIDAREEILNIEDATWYVLDRNGNVGYVSFIQDTESIANIGKVFPVVFFVVATLISLTSMTRMVEEQRMQIGTLKALGYSKRQIMQKYVIYAGIACVVGGMLGMSVGFVLLPKVIWMMYDIMYQMTDISISFNWEYGGMGLILISICIIGATIYTVIKELKNEPAILMRPKAPKSGNRVILEKIPFVWKRLNFSKKVTARNLFRYKKRLYMTVIGILGCTALILTGFGLKDSVTEIIPRQFDKVFVYDMQITIKDSIDDEQKEKLVSYLEQKDEIEKIDEAYMTSGVVKNGEHSEDVQIVAEENLDELDGLINIYNAETKEKAIINENEIGLTDKAAELLGVEVGDTIILKNSDDKETEVKISSTIENYVQHYVFMTQETYAKIYGETCDDNVILMKNVDLSSEDSDNLTKEIMERNEVASVSDVTSYANTLNDTLELLNYVVIVLIVSAGLLAFVVLYNLSNVNISERIRELATIKVLGFYDKEVYNYVAKETIILTVIGIILGLGFGYFLAMYILGTCEINMLRFPRIVHLESYIYSALITVVFTIIVNIATYFALKRIDMIESLKSIE